MQLNRIDFIVRWGSSFLQLEPLFSSLNCYSYAINDQLNYLAISASAIESSETMDHTYGLIAKRSTKISFWSSGQFSQFSGFYSWDGN